jgi:hypothetical protein
MAALRVADDHIVHQFFELLRTDLPGRCHVVFPVHVLRANLDGGHRKRHLHRWDQQERRTDDFLDVIDVLDTFRKAGRQLEGAIQPQVAFPVPGNDRLSGHSLTPRTS